MCRKTGYSRSKVYELLKRGFPTPIHEGSMALWNAAEVDQYMTGLIVRSRSEQGGVAEQTP